ncbi:central glycolytic regulator [Anoxybacillus sp. B7M1]|uniref:Sugar-binding domain-containing protein n=1 Tax=Anoxybacteroides rupiense TaxID=311460 RepID=A0ABD5IXP2_9BACL|nr:MULTISPECIES: sugar-binding domain-containing protein [Anoxybacillus]ANB57966.1 central glycolytic regulator [Anoxybacillus sp. B2M1]ANB64616.1 central glycolytic regulator [Anoxybacillus sp. B7M1]KXG09080.1 Central glycolytic genes regulator [Anoxybacillus sp. P3H1B]MBB3908668.1 central glycolytic genes regulator [Anoxybacillus rupiensis]MED5052510.1 sugar-binding domain-containing protein [Anoxybacillus rupiensis]
MRSWIDAQKKLLPDLLEFMQKRYRILQYIRLMQPIGRRALSGSIGMSERVLRAEVQFLKDQNLITITSSGMHVTSDGDELLNLLEDVMKELLGLKDLEKKVKSLLPVEEVIIVAGDSDLSPWVKKEMGRACVACMKEKLSDQSIVAVTGGTTMAAVADMMMPDPKQHGILFVPARGGLGEHVENQANTICAKMAEKAMGNYRLLHVPDHLSQEAYQSLIEEPAVKEVLQLIKSSNIVVHGIGDAITMAERRKTSREDMEKIKQRHAVAEAFGYYFNQAGEVVHKVQTIGIQLEDIKRVQHVIAVAGGASKAKAIKAYMKQAPRSILITDEGAARALTGEPHPLT